LHLFQGEYSVFCFRKKPANNTTVRCRPEEEIRISRLSVDYDILLSGWHYGFLLDPYAGFDYAPD
jgi:hypothetical protein